MAASRRISVRGTIVSLMMIGLLLALVPPATAERPGRSGEVDFSIEVLSSPPDLVSGDAARVLVHVPRQDDLGAVRVALNGVDVTGDLAAADDIHGLGGVVDGLVEGDNLLEARIATRGAGGRTVRETLTNHGIHEPMFSGPKQAPFACATGLGATGVGEGPSLQAGSPPDCDTGSVVSFIYRTTAGAWAHYDPASPPDPAAIAETTTLDGDVVPYVVRWERGTIHRFLYSAAVLVPPPGTADEFDPAHWNDRLIYSFQGGVGIGRSQGSPSQGAMLYEWGLANGYAVVWSSGTRTSTHYNLEVGGETAIKLKDHFVTHYGDPLYTVGVGGSGGAIQQYVYGQNHPWVIDAAIPQYSYPDMVTQTIHVGDCEPLERWADHEVIADPSSMWRTWSNRRLLQGLNAVDSGVSNPTAQLMPWMPTPGSSECINGWRGLSPLALNPLWPPTPGVVDMSHFGDAVNIYGEREDGLARRTWDNVGVQYGLGALVDGEITPTQFLHLNATVGSWKDPAEMVQEGCPYFTPACFADVDVWSARNMSISPDDGVTPAPRMEADPAAVRAAYERGLVFRGDIDIPIIDWRHYLEPWLDMHNSHQSFAARQRLLDHDRDASNHVIWFTDVTDPGARFEQTPDAFRVLDEWMANIQANPGAGVAGNKPAAAVDSCFDANGELMYAGDQVWAGILDDRPDGPCTDHFEIFSTSRIVAGGPISGDVYKCALQPVRAAIAQGLYGDWTPTGGELARLEEIFPDGVCDYRRGDVLRPANLRR